MGRYLDSSTRYITVRHARVIAYLWIAIIELTIATVFGVVAILANFEPREPANPGWAAVIVGFEGGSGLPLSHFYFVADFGPGDRSASYVAYVCGQGMTLEGVFLLGGGARLAHPTKPDFLDWRLGTIRAPSAIGRFLSAAQIIPFSLPPQPCDPRYDPLHPPPGISPIMASTGGQLVSPVRHRIRIAFIAGPHEVRAWPKLGVIPGVPGPELQPLGFPPLTLPGSPAPLMGRPLGMTYDLQAESPSRTQVVELIRPPPADAQRLEFRSATNGIEAVARLTDVSSVEHWATALNVVSIVFALALGGLVPPLAKWLLAHFM
jgi:hypothetical protein